MNIKFEVGARVWAVSSVQLKTFEHVNISSLNRNDPTTTSYEIKGPLIVVGIQIDAKSVEYRMNDGISYKESVLFASFSEVTKFINSKFKEAKPEKETANAV